METDSLKIGSLGGLLIIEKLLLYGESIDMLVQLSILTTTKPTVTVIYN